MKKVFGLILIVCVVFSSALSVCAKDKPLVGVIWYNFADTFIQNSRQSLLNVTKAGDLFEIIDADSQGDIGTQTNNLNNMYSNGVDYLVLNNIN